MASDLESHAALTLFPNSELTTQEKAIGPFTNTEPSNGAYNKIDNNDPGIMVLVDFHFHLCHGFLGSLLSAKTRD